MLQNLIEIILFVDVTAAPYRLVAGLIACSTAPICLEFLFNVEECFEIFFDSKLKVYKSYRKFKRHAALTTIFK